MREEAEAKRLEEEIAMQTIRAKQQQEEIVPPDAAKRNFNENDILGDVDRDEKGNVVVQPDQNGVHLDKQGRLVNERGYLTDT